jgi:phage shock protein A
MSDLIDKLNVLLRSGLNNFLGGSQEDDTARPGKIAPDRLGKDIDKEIAALRKQIETALTAEDEIQARLDKYQQQIEEYNQQADEALKRNDEANARALVEQMNRQEKQANMLRADLDEHRRATSEFIERVNMLEAMVSDARRDAAPEEAEDQPVLGTKLADLIRNVRERVQDKTPDQESSTKININKSDPKDDDADLSQRRSRLSKPE